MQQLQANRDSVNECLKEQEAVVAATRAALEKMDNEVADAEHKVTEVREKTLRRLAVRRLVAIGELESLAVVEDDVDN